MRLFSHGSAPRAVMRICTREFDSHAKPERQQCQRNNNQTSQTKPEHLAAGTWLATHCIQSMLFCNMPFAVFGFGLLGASLNHLGGPKHRPGRPALQKDVLRNLNATCLILGVRLRASATPYRAVLGFPGVQNAAPPPFTPLPLSLHNPPPPPAPPPPPPTHPH